VTEGPGPRVRRLPERAVVVELPGSADAVETGPTALPAFAPVAVWRRWGWAVAFVPTVALVVYQRLAADRDWPVTDAVVLVTTLGLVATALLALARYQDDRAVLRLARDRDALLADPTRATGTLALPSSVGEEPGGPTGRTVRGTLVLTTASGITTARPVRVVVPPGVDGPRAGDPVAVWHAAGDEDASGVLLVRYHRTWADDLVAALHPGDDTHGPEDEADDGGRAE